MNIILFGPPGAGKGTQADKIVKKFNLYKVSTGDLLREEIKDNTNFGNKIKSIIDKGLLVSDNIINDLIIKVLSDKKLYNRLIFDGYPRNLKQAKNLDYIVLNYANEEGAGCDVDTNHIYIYSKSGEFKEFDKNTKLRLAHKLIEYIINNEK